MQRNGPSWSTVARFAAAAGATGFVATVGAQLLVVGGPPDWSGPIGVGVGGALGILLVGVVSRRGWPPRSWRRGRDEHARRTRRSWPTIIGTAALCGALFYVVTTLIHRFHRHDAWDWSGAAGGAVAMTVGWLAVGAAVRWGWIPTSRNRDDADVAP